MGATTPDDGIPTRAGGALFVINAINALRAIDVRWTLVHRLAWACRTSDRLDDDPIWPILTTLAADDEDDVPDEPTLLSFCATARERIIAALQLESDDDLEAALLRRRGTLFVTRTHIDLMLPLDTAEIHVRRAGLDFSPGWVPALGRVIEFHYV